jgi:hypothetical protein
MDKRDNQTANQEMDAFIDKLVKGDGIDHRDRPKSFIAANNVPQSTYKPRQVVRLKQRYGDAHEGWIGIVVYYFSVDIHPNLCQVLLYDTTDEDEDAYTGESVFDTDLEPLKPWAETPPWFTFTVDGEGLAVDRLENRGDGEKGEQDLAQDKSSKDQGNNREAIQRSVGKMRSRVKSSVEAMWQKIRNQANWGRSSASEATSPSSAATLTSSGSGATTPPGGNQPTGSSGAATPVGGGRPKSSSEPPTPRGGGGGRLRRPCTSLCHQRCCKPAACAK